MERLVRRLGQIEGRMALMQKELAGTTQCSWMLVLEGRASAEAVLVAVRGLFCHYQALRCAIVEDETGWCFIEHADRERIEISHRCMEAGAARAPALERLFEELLNLPLRPEFALWRVVVVTAPAGDEPVILCTMHHAILDGTFALRLLEEMLERIDRAMIGDSYLAEDEPLGRPLDTFLRPASSSPAPASTSRTIVPFCAYAPLVERRTAMVSCGLSPSEHEHLQSRAAEDRVSVNALLAAAIVRATAACGLASGPLSVKTAVSLRSLVPKGEHGCYLTVADVDLDAGTRSLVELANAYDAELMAYVYERGIRSNEIPAGAMRLWARRLPEQHGFVDGIGLTNPGAVTLKKHYRSFRLVDYYACANRNAGNGAFVVTALSKGDELTLTLTFTEPLMERRIIVALGQALERELRSYAGR